MLRTRANAGGAGRPQKSNRRRTVAGLAVLLAVLALLWAFLGPCARRDAPADLAPTPPSAPAPATRRAPPPRASTEPASLDATVREVAHRALRLRDLADGSPVAGVEVRLGSGDVLGTSDGDGVVRHARADLRETAAAFVLSGGFQEAGMTGPSPGDLPDGAAGAVLWVYRMCTLAGVVRCDARDPAPVPVVSWCVSPGGPGIVAAEQTDPWSARWMRPKWFGRRSKPAGVAPDGTFSFTVPRIRGLAVIARSKDDRSKPDARRVEVTSATERVDVDLRLETAPLLTGVIRLPDGCEARDVRVAVHIAKPMQRSQFDPALLRLFGWGLVGGGDQAPDSVWDVRFAQTAQVGPTGEFTVPLHATGPVTLVVEAPPCFPETVPLGTVAADRGDVVITLRGKGVVPKVRLVRGGAPLASANVLVVDGGAEPGTSGRGPYRTSPSGDMETTAFRIGARYRLILRGDGTGVVETSPLGWFVFNNQAEIDVDRDLSRDAR